MKTNRNDLIIKQAVIAMHTRELSEIPEITDLEKLYVPLSEIFYKKIEKLLAREARKYQVKKWASTVAAIIVVIITLLLVANPGSISRARDAILRWFEQHMTYDFDYSEKELVEHEITYIPDGYELKEDQFSSVSGWIRYKKGEDKIDLFYSPSGNDINVDNEDAELEIIVAEDGTKMYYLESSTKPNRSLVWEKDGTQYTLISYLNRDEILKIQDSIRKISAENIKNKYEIFSLPEGYELEKSILEKTTGFERYRNRNDESEIIDLIYSSARETVDVNGTQAILETIVDKNNNGIYYLKSKTDLRNAIIWEEDGITFTLISTFDKEEILVMKESVQEKTAD